MSYKQRYIITNRNMKRIAILTESELHKIIIESARQLLTEAEGSRTRKNMRAVFPDSALQAKFNWPGMSYDDIARNVEGQPDWIHYFYHQVIETFRGALSNEKFIPGLYRILMDELGWESARYEDNRKISMLYRIANFIDTNPELKQKFSWNLNDLSYDELFEMFGKDILDNMRKRKNELRNKIYETPSGYEIVEIKNYQQAREIGNYSCPTSKLCYTEDERVFKYQFGGLNPFKVYVCLKPGWEEMEPIPGENAPFDEYGLSMIFVFIDDEQNLMFCNTRWNHEHSRWLRTDHILDEEQLSEILGINFYDAFPIDGY